MKALVLEAYKQLVYRDVPEPDVGPEEVLIAVRACGICGSDVHGLDGSTGRRIPPLVMGHEAAGVIVGTGSAVRGWAQGDRVTFDSTICCGRCAYCRAGQINLCDDRRVLGVSCGEYRRHGAFAERVAVPQHILYRLPDGLSFERAAMVEPLSVAVHGVGRLPLRLDDTGLVIGAGMIGLLALQVLRASGCGRILVVDVDAGRLDMARRLGASQTILSGPDRDVPAATRQATGGRGADAAVEAVGLSATVAMALNGVRKGGHVALIGNVSPKVELPLQVAVSREITLYGSCASCGEYPACLNLIARGAVDIDCLSSAVAPLVEGAAWFDRLYRREPGLMKVVLTNDE